MMIKVTWSFDNYYTPEEFVKLFSESNDLVKEGYSQIQIDFDKADSMDDLSLNFKIEEVQ